MIIIFLSIIVIILLLVIGGRIGRLSLWSIFFYVMIALFAVLIVLGLLKTTIKIISARTSGLVYRI
jgi:hypothetical protein